MNLYSFVAPSMPCSMNFYSFVLPSMPLDGRSLGCLCIFELQIENQSSFVYRKGCKYDLCLHVSRVIVFIVPCIGLVTQNYDGMERLIHLL